MQRGSLLILLLPALAEESWREDLGLHKTGQEQRRAAHWLADLDQAINFDLDTLATDHALRRSQISEEGWVATHAKWLRALATRVCAYPREGPTTQSEAQYRHKRRCATGRTPSPRCTRRTSSNSQGIEITATTTEMVWRTPSTSRSTRSVSAPSTLAAGGPARTRSVLSRDAPWSMDVYRAPTTGKWQCRPCSPHTASPAERRTDAIRKRTPSLGYEYDVDGTLLIRGLVRGPDGTPAKHALIELWHADPYGRAPFGGFTPLAEAHDERGTLPMDRYSLGGGGGCHVVVRTNAAGRFSIITTAPGAYGPPQHFEMYVYNAEGFAPLYTKVYLGDDPHLRTLGKDNVESLLRDRRVVTPQFSLKPTAQPSLSPTFDTAAPTAESKAPTSTPTIDTGVASEERLRLAERDRVD